MGRLQFVRALTTRRSILFATCVWALCGCHQGALRQETALDELPKVTSEELFQIGVLQARRGDLLRAEQYLTAARNQGFDEPTVVYWLVRVCVSAGRYHSALGHAVSYLHDHPSHWRLRLVVASIHEALGDFERAQRELENVVGTEPSHSLPRYRLAVLYRRQPSGFQSAVPHLEAYLELAPNGPHAAEVRTLLTESYGTVPQEILVPVPSDSSEPVEEVE